MRGGYRHTTRRFAPALFGVVAIVGGAALFQLAMASSSTSRDDSRAFALTADRPEANAAASRGGPRTSVDPLAVSIAEAASRADFKSPADELDPTTTTTAPSTTTTVAARKPVVASGGNSQTGGASYYAYKAGGCAHKTLPKGTVVTVTNVGNGKTATCVVNDRGPFIAGRIIDLDVTVFRQVASTSAGVFAAHISW